MNEFYNILIASCSIIFAVMVSLLTTLMTIQKNKHEEFLQEYEHFCLLLTTFRQVSSWMLNDHCVVKSTEYRNYCMSQRSTEAEKEYYDANWAKFYIFKSMSGLSDDLEYDQRYELNPEIIFQMVNTTNIKIMPTSSGVG